MSESSPGSNPLEKRPPVYVFRIQTPKRSATIRLDGPFFVLGRGEPYRIFHDDPTLSREHLALIDTPEGYKVKDLGSRNGVLLNGQRLGRYSETLLELGDVLVAGQTKIRLLLQQEAAAEAAAEAGEDVTAAGDGHSTAISALPTREEDDDIGEEDDDIGGEVTGTLDRPKLGELAADLDDLDPEATQFAMDEDEEDSEPDPEATQIALDEDEQDLEVLEDGELTLPDEGSDTVEALAEEIDAAAASNAARPAGEEPTGAAELAADLDQPEAELE